MPQVNVKEGRIFQVEGERRRKEFRVTKACPARDADGKAEDGGKAVALTAIYINRGCRCDFEPRVPGSDLERFQQEGAIVRLAGSLTLGCRCE